jgi:hypothetical protein
MNKILILSLAVLFFAAGCGEKTEYKIPTSETLKKENVPGVIFTAKKLSKSVNKCNPGDSGCSYIRINYSEAQTGKGKDKINALIQKMLLTAYRPPDKTFSDPQVMMDSYINDCESFKKENPKTTNNWSLDFNARLYAETDKLICLIFENTSLLKDGKLKIITLYKNVYKETGDTASFVDMLGHGFEDRLNDAIDKNYREWRHLKPYDDLKVTGELFQSKLNFTYNFAVTNEKGMELYYNTGEIMSASYGPIVIKLPPDVVKGLIYGDSPLR